MEGRKIFAPKIILDDDIPETFRMSSGKGFQKRKSSPKIKPPSVIRISSEKKLKPEPFQMLPGDEFEKMVLEKKTPPIIEISDNGSQEEFKEVVENSIIKLPPNQDRKNSIQMKVNKKLGSGSYGDVFSVSPVDPSSIPDYFPKNKEYALKIMKKYKNIRSFEYEQKIMNLITSKYSDKTNKCGDHILCYFDISQDKSERFYLLSEKMDGDVSDYNEKYSKNKYKLALKVFQQTLTGLLELSEVGLLHRDLKPENLLYQIPRSDKGRLKPSDIKIKITDFGLSCLPSSKDLRCGKTEAGTPKYWDPRIPYLVYSGKAKNMDQIWDQTNDTYSLAVLLYEILFGNYLTTEEYKKIKPKNNITTQGILEGYQKIYDENMVFVNDMIQKYKSTKTKESKQIVKMLEFMKRNLDPFSQNRTDYKDSYIFYI